MKDETKTKEEEKKGEDFFICPLLKNIGSIKMYPLLSKDYTMCPMGINPKLYKECLKEKCVYFREMEKRKMKKVKCKDLTENEICLIDNEPCICCQSKYCQCAFYHEHIGDKK